MRSKENDGVAYNDNLPNYPLISSLSYNYIHFNRNNNTYQYNNNPYYKNNNNYYFNGSAYEDQLTHHSSNPSDQPLRNNKSTNTIATGTRVQNQRKQRQRILLDSHNNLSNNLKNSFQQPTPSNNKHNTNTGVSPVTNHGTMSLTATLVVGSSLLVVNLLVFAAILLRRRRSSTRKRNNNANINKKNRENYGFNDRPVIVDEIENEFVLTDDGGFERVIPNSSLHNMENVKMRMGAFNDGELKWRQGTDNRHRGLISNYQVETHQIAGNYNRHLNENIIRETRNIENNPKKSTNVDSIEASTTLCTVISLDQQYGMSRGSERDLKDGVKKNEYSDDVAWKAEKLNESLKNSKDKHEHSQHRVYNPQHPTTQHYQLNHPQQRQHFSTILHKTPTNNLLSQPSTMPLTDNTKTKLFTSQKKFAFKQQSQKQQQLQQQQQISQQQPQPFSSNPQSQRQIQQNNLTYTQKIN